MTYFTTGRTIGTLKFHTPTNGKNRRSTNHYKIDTAFRNDDHMLVDMFFVSCIIRKKRRETVFENKYDKSLH